MSDVIEVNDLLDLVNRAYADALGKIQSQGRNLPSLSEVTLNVKTAFDRTRGVGGELVVISADMSETRSSSQSISIGLKKPDAEQLKGLMEAAPSPDVYEELVNAIIAAAVAVATARSAGTVGGTVSDTVSVSIGFGVSRKKEGGLKAVLLKLGLHTDASRERSASHEIALVFDAKR